MKNYFLLISLFCVSIHSQTYTNIASQSGIHSVYISNYYVPGGGVGFADYDNDGDPDILLCDNERFKLYRNSNSVFTDVTSQSGINFLGDCLKSVVWGDFNNDGWRDVYLTSWYSGNRLFKNNGNGTFSDVTSIAGVGVPMIFQSTTASWGDINNDGFIDLYVGNYGNIEGAGDEKNILFKNNGNGTFADITNIAGVADSVLKKPLATVIFDYNLDGWQDIYISMDKYQRSTLFKNNGNGTFTDVTYATHTMCYFDAMGIGVGDYNHDGYFDMHVSNGPPGNATFRNNGDGTFTDVAVQTNTTINKECWGNSFIDYDNDSWGDLFVTAAAGIDMCDVLYKNNHNSTFTYTGFSTGIKDSIFSYGAAKSDINNDGYPDLCVTMSDSNIHLYKNSGGSNKWLKLKCIGIQSNKDAIGTFVTVYTGGILNRQVILGGSSFLSCDDVELIFGLGSSSQADSVIINWTNGHIDRSYNIAANGRYTAIEGSGVIIGIHPISSEIPVNYSLFQNYPNPFNPQTTIKFSVPVPENVNIAVFDMTGRLVKTLVNQNVLAGTYETTYNAAEISSGMYFYRIKAGDFIQTKKMMLVK